MTPPAPSHIVQVAAQVAAQVAVQVAVEVAPAHLDHAFDYLPPPGERLRIGQRVVVPFAGRRRTGWVVGTDEDADPAAGSLKVVASAEPWSWFDQEDLSLYRWVARRYAGTLASVLRHLVPPRVAAVEREVEEAAVGDRGHVPLAEAPGGGAPRGTLSDAWRAYGADALLEAVGAFGAGRERGRGPAFWWRALPGEDRAGMVVDLVARCLHAGRSALLLSPEPASAIARAVLRMAGRAGADLHGGVPDRARYRAALRCRAGDARVAVGGRGAVLAPLRDLGLVVVEDEANPALKERRGPRHHAREVALARARIAGATAVLTGDLPSASLWRLLRDGHVIPVAADRASQRERGPRVDVVDLGDPRPGTRRARFTPAASKAVTQAVRDGGAAVVLGVRRGEGTALACRACGRRRPCPVCDGALQVESTEEQAGGETRETWRCATCGWRGRADACPTCGGVEHVPLAAGVGRLASELARSHPQAEVVRMEGFDADGPTRRPAVAVMTRGSVVSRPRWLRGGAATVVVVPDADALLGRPRLDAGEDALRLWLAAAHWTDHLVLQTREPGHPAVQALVRADPEGFWRSEAERRAELHWPPHSSLVRLSLGQRSEEEADEIAGAVREALPAADEVLGPDLDGALLVKSPNLRGTLAALTPLRDDWGRRSAGVRVDVDPL